MRDVFRRFGAPERRLSDGLRQKAGNVQPLGFFYGTIYMRIDMDYYYCLVYNMDNRHMDYYCYLHPLQL